MVKSKDFKIAFKNHGEGVARALVRAHTTRRLWQNAKAEFGV